MGLTLDELRLIRETLKDLIITTINLLQDSGYPQVAKDEFQRDLDNIDRCLEAVNRELNKE